MKPTHVFGRFASGVAVVLTWIWVGGAAGYPTYRNDASQGVDDCFQCHRDFRDPYESLSDGNSWTEDPHNAHRSTMLAGDVSRCNTCHLGSSRVPVFLNESNGATGFDPISCIGCHGRAEDQGVRPDDCVDASATGGPCGAGAGLRQHHFNANREIMTTTGAMVSTQVCADCHLDANPVAFTPVGENVDPPYYFTPDNNFPSKPTDPCNRAPELNENYEGTTAGLDNDGDLLYDEGDPDCGPDSDDDGTPDLLDNCPSVFNPSQADNGGLDDPGANGIGDACECGDVTNNGQIQINDATIIKRAILGLGPGIAAPGLCNVIGLPDPTIVDPVRGLTADCLINDATIVKRAILGLGPGIGPDCGEPEP